MNNAGFGTALVRPDLPLISRGSHQHHPRPGAQFPVLLERMRDRTRATNHLKAEHRILVDIGGRREYGDYLGPVSVHFVSQNHRQRSVHALTELKTIYLNNDFAVRSDMNKRIRRIDFRRRMRLFMSDLTAKSL